MGSEWPFSTVVAGSRVGRYWGKSRHRPGHQNDVVDPSRHFGTANCRIAKGSFNHLVGGGKQRLRNAEAERLRGLEVDD
jgi:hypothetical protein